jgi:serine/threonine protein phosphatase PrpC
VGRVKWGIATHVGCARAHNEDAVLARPPIFAVADGMGGHQAGEVASQVALATLEELSPEDSASIPAVVRQVKRANDAILTIATERGFVHGIGTTLIALSLGDDGELSVFNVGDSRAYRYRDGSLIQLSADHSVVAELVRAGRLAPSEAASHPDRHVVTRALGIEPDVEVDCWRLFARSGDRYLLCSDGLTSELSESEICAVLEGSDEPQGLVDLLVHRTLEAGARDNVSVILIEVGQMEGDADEQTNPRLDNDETRPVVGAEQQVPESGAAAPESTAI